MVFVSAAAAFCGSLARIAIPRALCIIILAGLIFYPGTFYTFDMPMSEGLFAIITLLLLTGIIWALTGTLTVTMLASASIGLTASLLVNERGNDTVLVYGMLIYAAAAISLSGLNNHARSPMLSTRALGSIVSATVMLLVFFAGNTADSVANYLVWGYFGPNELLTKGQQRLIGDLVAIDTGEQPIHKWIPITNETLQIAYRLSPILSSFSQEIEGPFRKSIDDSAYGGHSRTGIAGQFDISDIFGLVGTVLKPTQKVTDDNWIVKMQITDDLDNKIAKEIEQGFSRGLAKRKLTIYIWNIKSPLLLKAVRTSASHIVASFFSFNTAQLTDNFPFYGSLYSPLYDTMLGRRRDLVSKGPLEGFVSIAAPDEIERVAFTNNTVGFFSKQGSTAAILRDIANLHEAGFHDYAELGSSAVTPVSQDKVPTMLAPLSLQSENFYRFSIAPVFDRFFLYFGKLIVTDKHGRAAACENLGVGQLIDANLDQDGPSVKCLVTEFELHLKKWQRWGYAIQGMILTSFNASAKWGSALLVAWAAVFGIVRGRKKDWNLFNLIHNRDSHLVLGFLIFLILERILFFSFIDATIFPINDDRHLFDTNFLIFPVVLILCYQLSRGYKRR